VRDNLYSQGVDGRADGRADGPRGSLHEREGDVTHELLKRVRVQSVERGASV
jgi:hypothetical protein